MKRFLTWLSMLLICMFLFSVSAFAGDSDHYRDQLTDEEKAIYNALSNISAKNNQWIGTFYLNGEGLDQALTRRADMAVRAANAYGFDHPDEILFWNGSYAIDYAINASGTQFTMKLTFTVSQYYSSSVFSDAEIALEKAIQDVPLPTVYDKVEYVHSWLIKHAYYDNDALNAAENSQRFYYAHSPFGILLNGTGVCESYAKITKILCDRLSVPCMLVMSDSHMWNYVQMDDGKWYMLDCTWDDPGKGDGVLNNYFLVSNNPYTDKEHTPASDWGYPATATSAYVKVVIPECTHEFEYQYEYEGVTYSEEDFMGSVNAETGKRENGIYASLPCTEIYHVIEYCVLCDYFEKTSDHVAHHDRKTLYEYDGVVYTEEQFMGSVNTETGEPEGGFCKLIPCENSYIVRDICGACDLNYENVITKYHDLGVNGWRYTVDGVAYTYDEFYGSWNYGTNWYTGACAMLPCGMSVHEEIICTECHEVCRESLFDLHRKTYTVFVCNGRVLTERELMSDNTIPCLAEITESKRCSNCPDYEETVKQRRAHRISSSAPVKFYRNGVECRYSDIPCGALYTEDHGKCTRCDAAIGFTERMERHYGATDVYKVGDAVYTAHEWLGERYNVSLLPNYGVYETLPNGTNYVNVFDCPECGAHTEKAGVIKHEEIIIYPDGLNYVNGKWYLYKYGLVNNTYSGFVSKNGEWYYVKAGVAISGWQLYLGAWYYMDTKTYVMAHDKWVDGGNYYVGSDGKMATSTWIGNYYVGADGKWVPGAVKPASAKKGWVKEGSYWYYYVSGTMQKSKWVGEGNNYYVGADGKMAANTWIGNYYVGPDGKWVPDKKKDESGQSGSGSSTQTTAKAQWLKDSTGWWYRHADGSYTRNGWEKIDGKWYHFNAAGYMQTGWLQDGGSWYYLNSSGAMVTGEVTIDGRVSRFNASGVWLGYK